mmetsp:Transcript_26855/g.29941  ORF Transcript_26855/g.29941 Transcript_26855/m.29941 type:complete len:107 (+) Transcript_26855:198-518(+)
MVNYPKTRRMYCPSRKCKKHAVHKVSAYKNGAARQQSQGTRRYRRKQKGYGGQTKPIFKKKAKVNKKTTLKFECKECKAVQVKTLKRCKKFELGGEKKQKNKMIQF